MKPSQDQIKTVQKLLERMEKKDPHTHSKEGGYEVYEVRGGVVRRVVGEANHAPPAV